MANALDIPSLNERAERLGYEVVLEEPPVLPPSDLPGVPFSTNMGGGQWCRVRYEGGEPCFRFSWRTGEVDNWLTFREREARSLAEAA